VLDRLRESFGRLLGGGASSEELEAALALVVLAMFADRRVDPAETAEVHGWLAQQGSADAAALADRVPVVVEKVRRGLDQDISGQTVVDDVDRLVRDAGLRAQLPALCRSVVDADRQVAGEERDLLARIDARFG
jgi:hypothetical protein